MDRMDLFASALRSAAEQVKRNIAQFGEAFPLPCTEGGVYPTGINTDWTPGLFTGQCWLAYEATGDAAFRAAALRQVDSFARRLAVGENLDHHDLGFLYTPSCVAAWKLTGSRTGREAALEAARRLTGRFQPVGQFIQAWGILGMALAYRFTGEADYLERFRACARFFLQRLPADGVPYWDLVFTEGDEPRDSSAAAIAACGIDEANLWGDYFYMEALTRRTRRWQPYWA